MIQYEASWKNSDLEKTEEINLQIVTNFSCNNSETCPSRPGFSVDCKDGKCVYLQQLDFALFSGTNSFQATLENFNKEEIETINLLFIRKADIELKSGAKAVDAGGVELLTCPPGCRKVQQKCVCPGGAVILLASE